MIRIYLLIAVLILAFFVLRKFIKTPPAIISKWLKKIAVYLLLLVVIVLAATGRLNWLFALAGVFVAFMLRMLPSLLRYMPQLHGLWMAFKNNPQSSSNNAQTKTAKMSKPEAYEVLGLTPSATDKDIIMAHRQLIQKLHPDRGGSDYLAAQINLAKKVLLQK